MNGRLLLIAFALAAAAPQAVRYMSFAEAQDALRAFDRTEDAASWDGWIKTQDQEVRARVDRGVEDSTSNLILYGASFTHLPRLESPEGAVDSNGQLIAAARARVHALAEALSRPTQNERFDFAREFLRQRNIAAADIEGVLAANLTRFGMEQRGYQDRLRSAHQEGDPNAERFLRSNLFEKRGLSVDTSLLPNYALEDTLRAMKRKNAIAEHSVGTIAIIGPGLDFADKRDGYDFYPLQSIQPFALIEAVVKLGLAKPGDVHVLTFDLNAAVNAHLRRAAERARAGNAYVLQLPRDLAADWTPEASAYWTHFGDLIGAPAKAVPSPKGLDVRAVAIKPNYVAQIEPVDLNIVAQVLEERKVDLVIATNILVYYDRFQQVLAMTNIAQMMNPGGVFLSNTVLPAQRPDTLEYLGRRSVTYSVSGAYGDDVVVYRRK